MSATIGQLVERFDSGEIRLPIMQRDYVWKPRKMIQLLDSMYKGWPIGAFYVWQTNDDYPAKERAGSLTTKKMDGFYGYLLDGQQRLTSLSLAIKSNSDGDLATRGLFDVENERFFMGTSTKTITKRIEANDPFLVPLSELLLAEGSKIQHIEPIIRRLRETTKCNGQTETKYRERLDKIANLFVREALCEVFPEKMEEDAFELFSRLNKGGTTLSAGDVEGARLASTATKKIVGPMRAVAAEPAMRALGLNFIFLLRCLVTVHRGSSSFSKLPKNWADDAQEVAGTWEATEKAIRAVVKMIQSELGWTNRRWLPSTMALVPLVYLLARRSDTQLADDDRAKLVSYLLISGLRGIFRGSTEASVNAYVNAIRKARDNLHDRCDSLHARIPKNQQYKIRADEIRNSTGMYAPLMQIYLAMAVKRNFRSWPSGRFIHQISSGVLNNDPIAVHHIFPRELIIKGGVAIGKINTMANYAVLSQSDNAELADRDPFEVWRNLKSSQREWATDQLCISLAKEDLLKEDTFEDFLEYRAEAIAKRLNDFLGF